MNIKALMHLKLLFSSFLLAFFCILSNSLSGAFAEENTSFDYQLKPVEIAKNTWVFLGKNEDFDFKNGGNIANSGFIVTSDGIVVVDTGSSLRYGQQMRAAIAKISKLPIRRVFITHHHPDHFLGLGAFGAEFGYALAKTRDQISEVGDSFADNAYRLSGDWLKGTEVVMPEHAAQPGKFSLGGHDFEVIGKHGHTDADLMLFDHKTGVLFSGDLVFHNRCATTPHADVSVWLNTLDQITALKPRILVPGHGPISSDNGAVKQTRSWLAWLVNHLQQNAKSGFSMSEILRQPIPPMFKDIALVRSEYNRSVSHLYPAMEKIELGVTQ